MQKPRTEAQETLCWYFCKLFQKTGMKFTKENVDQVNGIVDAIIAAAKAANKKTKRRPKHD